MKKVLKLLLIKFIYAFLLFLALGCNNKEKTATEDTEKEEAVLFTANDSHVGSKSAHYNHELQYGNLQDSSEQFWDSIKGIGHTSKRIGQHTRNNDFRVFGWHVYSNGSAYQDYDFSLLWGIGYFAGIINPEDGNFKTTHQWKTTALIDSAKAHGTKVFLTLGNFGEKNIKQFLDNPKSHSTLIENTIHLLAIRKADGVNIDFEGITPESKSEFTNFVVELSDALKRANANYEISLCLYAVDHNKVFNIKALNPAIDFYTLMGYDYYGGFSAYAGPVTPMKSSPDFGKHSLETSVEYYLQQGVPSKQLIVGLPYYGAEWVVKNTALIAKSEKFKSHPAYKTIKEVYIDSLHTPVLFDNKSLSSYLNITTNGIQNRQLWFENEHSLSIKYDWIKSKNLGGVGIWALGDDHGHPELWSLLNEKFGEN